MLIKTCETPFIWDPGPDRGLPVPNRRDVRRGAVQVPDGAAAVRAGVAVEAEERPDEAAEPAVGSATANSRGIPRACTVSSVIPVVTVPVAVTVIVSNPLSLQGVSDAD